MSDVKKEVLRQVERLLRDGKSLVITTVDEPGTIDLRSLTDDIVAEVSEMRGKRCVQRVTMPDGTVICIKYED